MSAKSINPRRLVSASAPRSGFKPRVELLEDRWTPTTIPTGFTETRLAAGLASPTAMVVAPDGRVFVAEQGGAVRVIKNGTLLSQPFLQINVHFEGEAGLLGITVDPDFATNGYVYLYYTTDDPTLHNQISRVRAAGDVVEAGSKTDLLDLNTLGNAFNHNGGALHFGPDGMLYVAVGDNATPANAQATDTLLGKMLRIRSDGSIPDDNPFYDDLSGNARAIWALGLRNPFTFAFQPGTTRMFINDVGQNKWEEINVGIAGANYGWPTTEGPTSDNRFQSPLYYYDHTVGNAITGGAFYNPNTSIFPSGYVGDYFFADYGGGWIRRYDLTTKNAQTFLTGGSAVIDLDVDNNGFLYYLDRGFGQTTGKVYRIGFTNSKTPIINQQPGDVILSEGKSTTFSVSASGEPTLQFQWYKNGTPIAGATGTSYTYANAKLADNGVKFSVVVTNGFGTATSRNALLTVTANKLPKPTITTPILGTKFSAGETINFAGTATDPDDGTLLASAYTWRVDYYTGNVPPRPFVPDTPGVTSGSFTIPTTSAYTKADVFYRIVLTVVDSQGATSVATRDLLPRTATVTLVTEPAGLQLTLDGQPVPSLTSFVGVVGLTRSIGVPSPQTLNGVTWAFDHWSDGGAATHDVSTPASTTTYVATFRIPAGSVGSGTGLSAVYYNNENFTGKTVTKLDPTINFNWDINKPDISIGKDTFSVRWAGFLEAQFSESYVFSVKANDGVRLWVNDTLLIDAWGTGTQQVTSPPIALTAGTKYVIVVDYKELSQKARMQLWWSSSSTPKSVIPASQLYATVGALAAPWQVGTVGNPLGGQGTAVFNNGSLILHSGGAKLVHGVDNFHLVYAQLTGDGEIIARVQGLQKTDSQTHAGLMFRDSLEANPRFAAVSVGVGGGVAYTWRDRPNQAIKSSIPDSSTAPIWLRLRRTGNVFESFKSIDGVNWLPAGNNLVDMQSTVYVGLFVSSHSDKSMTTAIFDGIGLS